MSSLRLLCLETRRIVLNSRFVIALVLMFGLSVFSIWNELSPTAIDRAHAMGAISQVASDWLPLTIPLVAGIVAAGSLAADRHAGYVLLILARGVPRWRYIIIKAVAMALSSALAVLIGCLIFSTVALMLPQGRSPLADGLSIDALGAHSVPESSIPGPLPSLFRSNPVLNDILAISMSVAAAAAMALVGVFVGTLTANEYLAIASPFVLTLIFTIMAMTIPTYSLSVVSVFTYLDVWVLYKNLLPPSTLDYAAFMYWGVFAALLVLVSIAMFTRHELN